MIEENKRQNIKEELARADEAAKAATLLFDKGFYGDAVSRLYYFVSHQIRALLLTKGFEPRSHVGALRLLGLHFIKAGTLEPRISHTFSKLMKYREEADYNPSCVFTRDDFLELRSDEAGNLAESIKAYLVAREYV